MWYDFSGDMKKYILTTLFYLCLIVSVVAYANFKIEAIKINGLQGISRETVLSYLPVTIGSEVTLKKSNEIIRALYKTGFFDDIRLLRQGHTLVVNVKQRPIIGKISVTGNKKIPTKQLMKALKTMGFAEGQVYDRALLEKMEHSLKQEYFRLGKYNAKVKVNVVPKSRHRVAISIVISEGKEAVIHQIKIIGNHVFSESKLIKLFKLSTPGLLSFYTHDDQYSREKLTADLETLRSYYMDRGYLKFKIDSTQVSMAPDRKEIYITVRITEGPQYKISGYKFSGRLILSKQQLNSLILFKKGDYFSRKNVMATGKRIMKALGNKGYANAVVDPVPQVNEKNKTIFLNIMIKPERRLYVRRIVFSDNYRTNDNVFRREMTQMEGGALAIDRVEDSKHRLLLLPFVKNVQVSTQPVAGHSNQVDVNYKVKEVPSAELRAGIGYSQLDKFLITASVDQKNLFGTGNQLSFNIANSRPSTDISLNYYNPYATLSGIGRGISLYGTHFDSKKANISDYATNRYGLNVSYNFPMTEKNSVQFGYGYENDYLSVGSTPSGQLQNFIDSHGRHFYQLKLNAGWSYQSLDRYIFPTNGFLESANASATVPFSRNSLEYYKLGYTALYYHPIYWSFVGQLKGNVEYGNGFGRYGGQLPFFKNYFAGGEGSVRGFEDNTLGPRDTNGDPLGGNVKLNATAGLIFPNPFGDNVRTTWFVDVGNVYTTHSLDGSGEMSFRHPRLNELRYSTGLEVDWRSPVGILNFSLAKPLHKRPGDDTEVFQFNIGTSV